MRMDLKFRFFSPGSAPAARHRDRSSIMPRLFLERLQYNTRAKTTAAAPPPTRRGSGPHCRGRLSKFGPCKIFCEAAAKRFF